MTTVSHALNPPHGGTLVNLLVDAERAAELQRSSRQWPSWDLTPRQICDFELLANGGFSPLTGFLSLTKTSAPAAANANAQPRPIPSPAPVTNAARPSNRTFML